MDNYNPTNNTPQPPADFSRVKQAGSDVRHHTSEAVEAVADFAATSAQAAKEAAVDKAQNFRSYAGEKAVAMKGEASVKFRQGAERAKELHTNIEDYIIEHPTKAVLSALGAGVIIGLIMRR